MHGDFGQNTYLPKRVLVRGFPNMRVLIVDNSRLFHEVISGMFAGTPLEPELAESGQQALEAIRRNQYAFVCSSYFLPDMTGVELCRMTRKIQGTAYTPFILFTADTTVALVQEAFVAGVTDVFQKQDIGQLLTFIQRLLAHYEPTDGHVLVVEDSIAQAEFYSRTLTSRGMSVERTVNGEAALDLLDRDNFDLVVTDIVLSGHLSGIALANRIRRLPGGRGDVPILAVTAFDDLARRIELFYLGVNDYVIKPLVGEELIARARSLISHGRLRQRERAEHQRRDDASPAT